MNRTIYHAQGASLTFPESKQILAWIKETVAREENAMRESMENRGFTKDSRETAAMVAKNRIQVLKVIANTKPDWFEFKTTELGKKFLAI